MFNHSHLVVLSVCTKFLFCLCGLFAAWACQSTACITASPSSSQQDPGIVVWQGGIEQELTHSLPVQQNEPPKRLSKRRRARGVLSRLRQTIIKHTFVLPALILAIFGSLYAVNPTESNPVHGFIFLSYKLPSDPANPSAPAQYGKGLWDFAFVAFYTVVLSFTREFIMQEILGPLARIAGLRSKSKKARFMEQMYTAIYFGILGPVGMWVMSRTPIWYFNTRAFYEEYPHKTHDGPFKFYYLFQAAYWAQQAIVLVLGMEKPRKDFKELVGHHIVSLALIWLSYRFHFTYIGIAVYTTHDISDFFLAVSVPTNFRVSEQRCLAGGLDEC
jgi:very-long-chain ceramide synthase